jgi:hypothetical protein
MGIQIRVNRHVSLVTLVFCSAVDSTQTACAFCAGRFYVLGPLKTSGFSRSRVGPAAAHSRLPGLALFSHPPPPPSPTPAISPPRALSLRPSRSTIVRSRALFPANIFFLEKSKMHFSTQETSTQRSRSRIDNRHIVMKCCHTLKQRKKFI